MYVSELKKLLEIGCNQHHTLHRASGETSISPPEMRIYVPYFSDDGTFYGYNYAYAYYDALLDAFIIEQPPMTG